MDAQILLSPSKARYRNPVYVLNNLLMKLNASIIARNVLCANPVYPVLRKPKPVVCVPTEGKPTSCVEYAKATKFKKYFYTLLCAIYGPSMILALVN